MNNEIIKITTNKEGIHVVNARELFYLLGFNITQYKRWYRRNILNNPFAYENRDWVVFDMMSKSPKMGRPTMEFAITIDFAKGLCMLARTEKGEEIRNYFIQCEKQLKQGIEIKAAPVAKKRIFAMKSKKDDPKVLRKRIIKLESQIKEFGKMLKEGKPVETKRTPANIEWSYGGQRFVFPHNTPPEVINRMKICLQEVVDKRNAMYNRIRLFN